MICISVFDSQETEWWRIVSVFQKSFSTSNDYVLIVLTVKLCFSTQM